MDTFALDDEYKDNDKWMEIIDSVDQNNDGQVSFDEFCAAFDDFIVEMHNNWKGLLV